MRRTILAAVIGVSLLPRLLLAQTTPAADASLFNQDSHDSTGFGIDAARVDSQITLKIPDGKAPEVYRYLVTTYVENDEFLKKAFPKLDIEGQKRTDISNFVDEYFDTPDLALYAGQNSVRHRSRTNTTDPTDRKSGRELVQLKVTPPGRFDLRTELKFDVEENPKLETVDDRHPLIKLVNDKQRADFKDALTTVGINPYSLRRVITNKQVRSRVYINLDKKNILSFSVDEYGARVLFAKAGASSVDVGLVENAYTEADATTRQEMQDIRNVMLKDLKEKFPELSQNEDEKYAILINQLTKKVPLFRLLVKLHIV